MEREIIVSRQNRTVVETAKLLEKKARDASRCFRFDGIKLLEEAIRNHVELLRVLVRESCTDMIFKRFPAEVFSPETRILILSDEVFDKISEEKSPEGVICVAKYIDKLQKIITIYNDVHFLPAPQERIALIESVRDPSNIGAIIRSAAALGIDRLIMSADCADIYHPRAVRASMGTLFNQRIDRTGSLPEVIEMLRASGRRVYAAALDPEAERLGSFRPERADCIVIGNEGHGLSETVLKSCSGKIFIPMSGRAESLNAAVAAAILMWEFSREG